MPPCSTHEPGAERPRMNLALKGKVALIAGSSRGIGLAIAEAFLREEASVCITGRDAATLEHARRILAGATHNEQVTSITCDMTRPEDINSALAHTFETFGHLDAVVANVGSGAGPAGWD